MDELKAGARIDVDEDKRNPGDFVLWFTKSKFEKQALVWDSPWGRGYPGWHIECSAMSIKYLGENFDIHAGGIDHIPVHHTNEIAQSEAATGKRPWVNYWIHNEFLVMDKGKMSKSTGGFLTLQTLIDSGYDPLDYRYFLLGGHYKSQLQFSWEALDGAKNSRKSLVDKLRLIDAQASGISVTPGSKARQYISNFDKTLCDDLSTPRSLAELWGLLRDTSISPEDALAVVSAMDEVLGLNLLEEARRKSREGGDDPALTAEIEGMIKERNAAKKAKDFNKADEIRRGLKERGIILEDTPSGTKYRKA
jgi:cysteinyl-tRNA synthetase